MSPYEYLRRFPEQVPCWLDDFCNGDAFACQAFFASRIVCYPGSGTDGHPVKLFGSTHSAHSFVYVDYGITQAHVETELEHPIHRFRGYHTLARLHLTERDLTPAGWVPHVGRGDLAPNMYPAASPPFGLLEVLERDRELDDGYGSLRLAILFVGADGIAAYDALFCQGRETPPPFAVVVQDHGMGGNYDRFGRGGLLERIALDCHAVPRWLLVAENTNPWESFVRLPDVEGDRGGMHNMLRFLYEKCDV